MKKRPSSENESLIDILRLSLQSYVPFVIVILEALVSQVGNQSLGLIKSIHKIHQYVLPSLNRSEGRKTKRNRSRFILLISTIFNYLLLSVKLGKNLILSCTH